MNSSCESYILFLLFCLISNFLPIFAVNRTYEQNIPTKVLINFLKVPWINLNSSWKDAVSPVCRDDIATLFESANAGEMWALKMLDATSKIPPGILSGNIRDPGVFDECRKVVARNNRANIQGQHCMVAMAMPTKFFGDISEVLKLQRYSVYNPNPDDALSLTTAVCLPSSCDELDINGLVNASIASSPEFTAFEVSVARVRCTNFRSADFTLGTILVMSFFGVIAILLLSCTVCDVVIRARSGEGSMAMKIASQFSLYTNIVRLSSTKLNSDIMPAINGIRFYTLCLVIFGHRAINSYIGIASDVSDFFDMQGSVAHSLLLMVPLAVDTFFVLSGFLVTLTYLQMFRSGKKINIFHIYLHRYLRLTPCIAVLLLFTIFIIPHLGSGPNWKSIYEMSVVPCTKNWWTNLLHVQNIVNVEEICLLHTWYVAVEMQLYWLSPIILYPLYYWPKFGLLMLSLLMIAAFSIPGVQLAVNQWVYFWDFDKSAGSMYSEFLRSYPMTYNRALPYLIGILLGYDVFYNKRQLSKFQTAFNWILAGLFLLFCGWTSHCSQPNADVYNVMWEVTSVSVARLGWSFIAAWTIYACTQGYGGLVTRFLSLPMYIPFARLTYSIYLVHFVLQVAITATERTADYYSPVRVMYLFWGDMAVSIVIASVLYLCIESPVHILEKMIRSGRLPATVENRRTAKQTTLSTAVNKYLDEINGGKTNSDFIIETITSKLDFWRAVSNDLNRLSKGPLRTPIEWSKAWQHWRSEYSNIADVLKAESTDIRNEQSQTTVAALEKDLMVFLAALNCSVTHEATYKASEIIKSKSQSDFYNRRDKGPVRLAIPDSDITDDAKSKFSGVVSLDDEYAHSKL